MESNGRERTSLQSYEERQSDCSQSCSDASDSGSRPDSTQSQKRVTPQSFDQTAIKKQNMLDSTPSFTMPGCPSAPFPTFSSSPLIISPTMFKPIISSVVNQGRPLNLSMANATVDSVGFAPQQSSNQCYSGSSLSNQSELMTSNQIIRNAIKRPSPGLLCVVCGDTSSGKHYGILACNGCSGFFKRSVRRKLIYRCQAGTGNCVIDKQHRNQCQSCRLKKCISMGMNKDAVQNERQPRNTGIRSIANTRCSTLGFPQQNQLPSDMRNSININRSGEESLEDNAKELERNRISAHFDYNNSGNYHVNVSNPVGALSSFGYSASADQAFNAMIHCHSESIYETSARLLFMAVKWAKNLPSFANLTFRDQVILLEESWAEIFLLSAIQWCLPLEKCPMFSIANIPEGSDHSADIRVLSDALNRFRSTSVDPAEFACLKALALFKPEARGLKDVTRIEHMQDQAQLMLLQHVKAHNPTNPTRYTYGKAVVRYV